MKNTLKCILGSALVLMLGGLLVTGCDSDSVAPQDQTPEMTEESAANQAALVALAMAEVSPQLVNFTPSKTVYTYDFAGYDFVTGSVQIDYRLGGAEGASSTPGEADWAHLWTVGENGLVLSSPELEGLESATYFTADITADIDQMAETATILAGSGGHIISGVIDSTYEVAGLVVGGTGYPSGGTLTFIGGGHTIVVAFDGTVNAQISLDGATQWVVNLDTGVVSDYMPPTF